MKPRSKRGLVIAPLADGECVVSTADRGDALVLNETGRAILELCDGEQTVAEIAAFVSANVKGADPAVVEHDVTALVDRLLDAGLIEDAEACATSPSAG